MSAWSPYDAMLPVLRMMHEARSDRERAELLLCVPDLQLMKYREAFEQACERAGFTLGQQYINFRRAGWHAVRGPDGQHKNQIFEQARAEFAAFARGENP